MTSPLTLSVVSVSRSQSRLPVQDDVEPAVVGHPSRGGVQKTSTINA
ncbi:hypothetical protein [Micromonospora sp. KC213]|nr:hypothetical protein [Micromonospora sp. KC213]